jgi:hypothetical protein
MRKLIISLVLSVVGIVPLLGRAQELADNAPSTYTVVRGDTLWGIAGRFLKDPWRWPEIWNMNREEIKNPHWIYPGDVIRLDISADGKPRLSIDASASVGGTVKLSPSIRTEKLSQAIPSIPGTAIGPFLSLPLVIDAGGMENAPKIVANDESRVVIGAGNIAYVDHVDETLGVKWQVYRPGKALLNPDTQEILGQEAIYIGDARVTRFGQPTTIEIIRSEQEINRGDRLTPNRETAIPSYSPHAPEQKIQGKIISLSKGVAETAQYAIVALNLGKKDGMEVGHVLATYRAGERVSTVDGGLDLHDADVKPNPVVPDAILTGVAGAKHASSVKLPDERNGLVFVFRVFDRVSYALIMQSRKPVRLYDIVKTP